MIQRLRRSLPSVFAQRTSRHSIISLMLLVFVVVGQPKLSDTQQTCLIGKRSGPTSTTGG